MNNLSDGSTMIENLEIKYESLCKMYEQEKKINSKLLLINSQREALIENLYSELSKRDVSIASTFYKRPSEKEQRNKLEKLQNKLRKGKSVIERYLDIIQDLYNFIETITGTKLDRNNLEILRQEKVKANDTLES
jgi:hypothetical protein